MTPRERLCALLNAARPADPTDVDRPLVDIGSSAVTGVRDRRARLLRPEGELVGHPVAQTGLMGLAGAEALRSDFVREGLVYRRPRLDEDDTFVDALGVRWLWGDGEPAPLEHPQVDGAAQLTAAVPVGVVVPEAGDKVVMADAPAAGLVEHCCAMRGQWQFLTDVSDDPARAAGLLDQALGAAVAGYESLLRRVPESPDIVLYADDLGWRESMYLSAQDLRSLVLPRLRELVAHIRTLADTSIALAVTGAVTPVLGDLASLDVELLNIEHDARGLDPATVRRALPAATVLHGVCDLAWLGRAVAVGDLATVANLSYQFARCWPVVGAPAGSLALAELPDAVTGAAFLAALDGADIALVRQAGPVRAVLERCLAAANAVDAEAATATYLELRDVPDPVHHLHEERHL